MNKAHYFASPDMGPEDTVWENRDVALPAWMWKLIDQVNETHAEHGCWQSTNDLFVAMGVRHLLGDPNEDNVEMQGTSVLLIEGLVRQLISDTTEHPLCTLDDVARFYGHLVDVCKYYTTTGTNEQMSIVLADSIIRLAIARGHRLSLVEDINTVIKGSTCPEDREAFKAALDRLGGGKGAGQEWRASDGDEG